MTLLDLMERMVNNMGIGLLETVLICGAIFLFFGAKKMPEIAEGIKRSKEILKEDDEENKDAATTKES